MMGERVVGGVGVDRAEGNRKGGEGAVAEEGKVLRGLSVAPVVHEVR